MTPDAWHEIEIEDDLLHRLHALGWVEPTIAWRFTEVGQRKLSEAIRRMEMSNDG